MNVYDRWEYTEIFIFMNDTALRAIWKIVTPPAILHQGVGDSRLGIAKHPGGAAPIMAPGPAHSKTVPDYIIDFS